jgi:hypothetical protein
MSRLLGTVVNCAGKGVQKKERGEVMKKLILMFAATLLLAAPALADYSGGTMYWDREADYYAGRGGEFTLSKDGTPQYLDNSAYAAVARARDGDPTSFQTFCVETGEFVSQPMNVNVSTTYAGGAEGWSHAVMGGTPPLGDNLETKTAYLYTQFATGLLSNYAYTAPVNGLTRAQTAGALQRVIWSLEGEGGDDFTQQYMGVSLGSGQVSLANAWLQEASNAGWTGIGDVRVLNMSTVTGGLAQDQLYLVPAPGAVVLALMGLGLVGWVRKRVA